MFFSLKTEKLQCEYVTTKSENMAIFYPSLDNIKKEIQILKSKHQEGLEAEEFLLNVLAQVLDDNYEVYYQPYLNGDRPDIVIMRKNQGVLIIEVKHWDLDAYEIDANQNWTLKNNKLANIKSPIKQVKAYKNNLFNLHIPDLLERQIEESKLYGIVSCALYFHDVTQENLVGKLHNAFKTEKSQKYIKVFAQDMVYKPLFITSLLPYPNKLFDEELYNSFKRYLQPPFHSLEDVKEEIQTLTPRQKWLAVSEPTRAGKKIKGVAGCGKTLILAQRAVNAYKRTGRKVLILTFNITLINYIKEQICKVKDEFWMGNFEVISYHQFIKSQANNLGVKFRGLEDFENEDFFESVKNNIKKYPAIFIDEMQDFKEEWQRIIRKYFWEPENGEYVVFGDVKQNIYNREIDEDKNFKTVGIPGIWNNLKQSWRMPSQLAEIATEFQKEFFGEKYRVDQIESFSEKAEDVGYKYLFLKPFTSSSKIVEEILSITRNWHIHPNDVAILSPYMEILREIDYEIRITSREKTNTIFESKELSERFKQKTQEEQDIIEKIRNSKKLHFWMGGAGMKLSTIYSFKGWEIHTLFLVIENYQVKSENEKNISLDELVYTGLTRCRRNLIIINLGNSRYDSFFAKFNGG